MPDVVSDDACNFLRSVLAPAEFTYAPPNLYDEPTFEQEVNLTGNIRVQDASPLLFEQISSRNGAVLWFPLRGVGSIYRYGFVPTDAVSLQTDAHGIPATGARTGGAYYTECVSILWDKGAPLPYGPIVGTDLLRISPQLQADYSQVKAYSGQVTIVSDAVPIGSTAITGELSAGVIIDTRNVALNSSAQGDNVFSIDDLLRKSVTSKEGISQVPTATGLATIQGPDINQKLTAPDQSLVDHTDSEMTRLFTLQFQAVTTAPNATAGVFHPIVSHWYTPWYTQMNVTPQSGSIVLNHYNVPLDTIDEHGMLDVEENIQYALTFNPLQVVATYMSVRVFAVAYYYFAYAAADASVRWNVYQDVLYEKEQSSIAWQGLSTAGATLGGIPTVGTLKSSPRKYATGLNTIGKYIGTQVVWYVGATADVAHAAAHVSTTMTIASMTASVVAHGLQVKGQLGPCHVLRWDNVSNGQTLKVSGVFNVQAAAKGSIASLTQKGVMTKESSNNINLLPLVSALFDQASPWRRNWTIPELEDFQKATLKVISPEYFQSLGVNSKSVAVAAHAAGLFSTLGGIGGQLASMGMNHAMSHLMPHINTWPFPAPTAHSSGEFGLADGYGANAAGGFGLAGGAFTMGPTPAGMKMRTAALGSRRSREC